MLMTGVFLLLGFVWVIPVASKNRIISVQQLSPRGKTLQLALDSSVKSYLSHSSASNIANLSLSPWTYIDSFNSSRLPQRILQANCSTSSCLNLQGRGDDATLQVKPIKYQVLVLYRALKKRKINKKGKKKNKYIFMLGTEEITVGCTCVRPTVIPQE
ncbi:interleukin 17a/f3 isoform X1 [Poeciliopsis prolifica]|uniref:interleukin 17a/f3 isoform X1 n=1 Tax=Poeciliopsis prolifica TaxID=188132 RepID=UPI002413AEB2|nr:interleukin 17a/f3 isoform X1 [Poeciliopsis prolifica]